MDQLMDLVRTVGGEDPHAGLTAAAEVRRELERLEAVQVRKARVRGSTWADIAAALGISKQAVHKKYGGRNLFHTEK